MIHAKRFRKLTHWQIAGILLCLAALASCAHGTKKLLKTGQRNPADTTGPCLRFAPGSEVLPPAALFSQGSVLKVTLAYRSSVDASGNTLYCYTLPDGSQSPTLHVKPGDHLVLTLQNETKAPTTTMQMSMQVPRARICGSAVMNDTSTNLHFHGLNISPTCHQDDVIYTAVNAGESFTYNVQFPDDEPPGLYWYHPHIHGKSEAAVLGGASGALIVDGIENIQPETAGLPERLLLLRDQLIAGDPTPTDLVPSWDLSLNFVPIPYPSYPPAVIRMKPGAKEFWRVANIGADTILDLQLLYDDIPQPLEIVALDGVPTGSQDGEGLGSPIEKSHVLLVPATRAEFIVTAPKNPKTRVKLVTLGVDTGPDGDSDPARPIATVSLDPQASPATVTIPEPDPAKVAAIGARFHGLAAETPVRTRKIYFSESFSTPGDPNSSAHFYITEEGNSSKLFSFGDAPSITARQGTVEDWVVENRTQEIHTFHIHQLHFLLLERNGVPVSADESQYRDTIELPYWSGQGPYPNVKLRMDFRGPIVGDFVYHCHILEHEDGGMMAIIRVLPKP